MIAVTLAALLMAGLMGVVNTATLTSEDVGQRNKLTREARFAMQRLVAATQHSRHLILPLADNPATDWREHVREQTVPASPPEGSSTKATAVLAITLNPALDIDNDGWADANNDRDYFDLNRNTTRDVGEPERLDEDLGDDMNNDGMPGIKGIDDDGDGAVDESDAADFPARDDDEQGDRDEDFTDGIDDDADGSEGEDGTADMNKDFAAGLAGIDDNEDGTIDEGHQHDDDEDGLTDEDWLDTVVFYLVNGSLTERMPVPWDEDGSGAVTGGDFVKSVIADNVTHFRVERLPLGSGAVQLVDLTLELTDPDSAETIRLQSRVRVGGAL